MFYIFRPKHLIRSIVSRFVDYCRRWVWRYQFSLIGSLANNEELHKIMCCNNKNWVKLFLVSLGFNKCDAWFYAVNNIETKESFALTRGKTSTFGKLILSFYHLQVYSNFRMTWFCDPDIMLTWSYYDNLSQLIKIF